MIAVIGDIHGCYYTLKNLVSKIRQKYPGITLYSVGDLVDRGNFSYEVVDFIISEKINFVPGNHDLMFYNFIKHPASAMGTAWLYNGYEKTVASYNNHFDKLEQHLSFINQAPLFINIPASPSLEGDDCFISHAGVSKFFKKDIPSDFNNDIDILENILKKDIESPHGILWTRDELVNLGKLQIVGHTRMNDVTFKKNNNVVYIDTSVYTGNKLSAVVIANGKIIDALSEPTNNDDIK